VREPGTHSSKEITILRRERKGERGRLPGPRVKEAYEVTIALKGSNV
jgi:hypothetical protein